MMMTPMTEKNRNMVKEMLGISENKVQSALILLANNKVSSKVIADALDTSESDVEVVRAIMDLSGDFSGSTVAVTSHVTQEGEFNLKRIVTDMVRQLGVPAHIKGYEYLRDAVMMCVDEPTAISAVTKLIYPSIAEKYETTPSRVERAIRHAIEVAWARVDVEVLQTFFGYTIDPNRGKPTNSEFIALIADKVRLDYKL